MFQNKMDSTAYLVAFKLEKQGKLEEGYAHLEKLANEDDPLALIELGIRFLKADWEGVKKVEPDTVRANELMTQGREHLKQKVEEGDTEAMRMLGYTYLGLLGVFEKSLESGEKWLLKSFESGCCAAANDLCVLYQETDIEKAKFYYAEAERLGCRFVFDDNLET